MGFSGRFTVVVAGLVAVLAAPRPLLAADRAEEAPAPRRLGPPDWLPRYDLDITLLPDEHRALVRQRITWTNRHPRPAAELVFNVHSYYKVPEEDVGFLAKTLEILRNDPRDALELEGHACAIHQVRLLTPPGEGVVLPFHYQEENATALAVPLPRPVGQGEAVTVEVEFILRLPQKQGRWGQWEGVTFLSNWLPVLAYYDEHGWQPTPFVPWHQPWFNEAGVYTARLTVPCGQRVACSAAAQSLTDLGHGRLRFDFQPFVGRDFAVLCSARYQEFVGQAGPVKVRCLAFPEHAFYAREIVRIASEALLHYAQWFGPYPYPEFTIAESYFGWLGNECAGLVMIDERVFTLPHFAKHLVDYLVSHETCHQWWYNVVGTNGYAETWMDEGLATHFSHRLMDLKLGKNNRLLTFPRYLEWLPNVKRESYRCYGMYGTLGRGEAGPVIQEMPRFGHIVNLFSMCYDKGSKIVGLIEDRLGEAAFLDFMRLLYARYQFRVLRVADFQRELEAYTGRSWEEFFQRWLYGGGFTDWSVETVSVAKEAGEKQGAGRRPKPWSGQGDFRHALLDVPAETLPATPAYRVTVLLHQKAEYNEQTVVGFRLKGCAGYDVRVPVLPQVPLLELDDPPARVEALPDNRVRVEVLLPCKPVQVTVDPDQVLPDRNPANNTWKPEIRWRFSPVYTLLDETDLTTDYDRWNVTAGPWFFDSAYWDPWYIRSAMVGLRAGVYRTQFFSGGVYAAYRTEYRDLAVGVDALWDHWPWSHTQVGFNAERSLSQVTGGGPANQGAFSVFDGSPSNRASVFGRYVFQYGDSLYLPPMHFLEAFNAYQTNAFPTPREQVAGAVRIDNSTMAGLHYHLDYLTPYWDPVGGIRLDATYGSGVALESGHMGFHRLDGQFSFVQGMPDGLGLLSETYWAARVYGGVGLPTKGEYFTLGGADRLRGFDFAQRQGSLVWIGSLEWRVPLLRHLEWDVVDHAAGLRGVTAAAFYDAGDAYTLNRSPGNIAQSVGAGLRFDVALFSVVERITLRLDVAKAIDAGTPVQFWFGVQQPF
jgi:hypothetical protein